MNSRIRKFDRNATDLITEKIELVNIASNNKTDTKIVIMFLSFN